MTELERLATEYGRIGAEYARARRAQKEPKEDTTEQVSRSWVARCQYQGLDEFVFGTVFTGRNDGEEAARMKALDQIDAALPTRPNILSIERGCILVNYE